MIETKLQKQMEDIARKQATLVYKELATRFGVAYTSRHIHNGQDSQPIPFSSVRPFNEYINWTIPGVQAATATNYGVIWICPANAIVKGFWEVHQTAGSSGGTVSLQLEKLTGTQAPNAGVALLQSALSLKATANTVQEGTLVETSTSSKKDVSLSAGDRLCLKDAGTLTAVANVTVQILITYP